MQTHLYSAFVDLTKAFDTVNRDGLWKIMQKFGCPERFTQMVRQLNDGMMARVMGNGDVSEALAVTFGMRHGCVLTPALLSLMFSAMLMDAYRDERPGVRIAYRTASTCSTTCGCTSCRVYPQSTSTDDCALNTTSEGDMQRSMDLSVATCDKFRLVINTEKMVHIHQPPPDVAYVVPQINMNGAQLQIVNSFTYPGSMLSPNTKVDDEVALRISNATHAFDRLQNTVWNRHGLHLNTKLRMCTVVILRR
nr:unnamed protein product [Spirometra erinaceieuropaei]